jgi:glycerol uptake facilitator-like aquaporin
VFDLGMGLLAVRRVNGSGSRRHCPGGRSPWATPDSDRGLHRRRWRNMPKWGAELIGTSLLLFLSVTLVRWLSGPGSHLTGGGAHLMFRLTITGIATGTLITAIVASPLGRASGGHVNPAVSFGSWALGILPMRELPIYLAAQLVGSGLGVAGARLVWGAAVASPEVRYGALHPGRGIPPVVVGLIEAASLSALMVLVALAQRHAFFNKWLSILVGTAVALLIMVTGAAAGGSFNPVRQLWPYLLGRPSSILWWYLFAPAIGGIATGLLCRSSSHIGVSGK